MITIKAMKWGNWFSYGDDNFIQFDDSKVIQITGLNGSGKSSIPVIIGEVLCNKNALGKTKAKLSNRYLDDPTWAKIWFNRDEDEYIVDYSRKSTLKLSLFKNGVDISSHSTTNTYITLLDILGYDFKTLWGLIYQSSKEGLEFLTATDTNRKKFLIKLFNLNMYLHIHDNFKILTTNENTKLQVLKGKISTIESWIGKNKKENLIEIPLEIIPIIDNKEIDNIANLKIKLANIHDSNKKINDNNQLKEILKGLDTSILNLNIDAPENLEQLVLECTNLQTLMATNIAKIGLLNTNTNKIQALEDKCPTCEQFIDNEFKDTLLNNNQNEANTLLEHNERYTDEHARYALRRLASTNLTKEKLNQDRVLKEFTDLLSKIDKDIPEQVLDEHEINSEIWELEQKINNLGIAIASISKDNLKAEAHNSKVQVIKEQLIDYKDQYNELDKEITLKNNINSKLDIIKKAFGTNGLLRYKIEHLSTELEEQINIYLAELSKGRFQLGFTIVGEKLNVEIIDDGISISIEELSAGELARVNTATLLAIRKLMAAISSTKINILFLDEIFGVLDEEGKEALIEILNSETELNTFLVSHEFTHPLIPQINIIKENKISRIEE